VDKVLVVRDLRKYFPVSGGFFRRPRYVRAVDGVSFDVAKGETLGLVGESGCGKSTLAMLVMRLIEPTGGRIIFKGVDITALDEERLKEVRRDMGIVFQDPYSSLNPRMTVFQALSRPLVLHGVRDKAEVRRRVIEMLELVGLGEEFLERYPHQLSGGQLQRVAIARAIILNPTLTIFDEPTSSLDVSVQSQILNLILDLQRRLGLTYIFISHDLMTVRHVSDRIAVMYLGKIVEMGDADEVFHSPLHPYTAALITSFPLPNPRLKGVRRLQIRGEVPSAINPPPGCRFHTRCPYATSRCRKEEPRLMDVGHGHMVACHRYGEIDVAKHVREFWRAYGGG